MTADGGYLGAGSTKSDTTGSIWKDILLVKIDSAGSPQWILATGMTGEDEILSVTEASDGGYVFCGKSDSINLIIFKTTALGAIEWTRRIGDGTGINFC